MAKSAKRPLAVFYVNRLRKIGDFIIKVKAIVADIAANTGLFTTPSPALATVTTHVAELDAAETLAQTRVVGSAAARDEKYNVVLDDMRGLLAYVQTLADNSPNTTAAITLIQSSGFGLKVNGVRVKPPLEARNTPVSGVVQLIAKAAGKRASYNWQYSTDAGTSWSNLPNTLVAKTMVADMRPASIVQFRVQATTKEGIGPWSSPVSLVIM